MKRGLLVIAFVYLIAAQIWAQYDTLIFSSPGGFYNEVFSLELTCGNPNNHIRYTTNGNRPTAQSALYSEPLVLDERMYSKSNIYTILNCPEDQFRLPDHIDRCIVVRAAIFDENDNCVSTTVTNSYFISALGCNLNGLPAVSLCVDSIDLFDFNKGIFIAGANYDPENPRWSGNYYQRGKEWERWANFEFYEYDNTGVNQQCGIRTHGGNGRRFQQKTFKIYAREKYGKKRFKHRFFKNIDQRKFKILVLRPFLSNNAGCEDYVCNCLAQQLNIDFMANRPTVMFINGEYWGIYYVKEKPDEHYIEDHYGIDADSVNLQYCWWGTVENGSPDNYKALQQWMGKADLSDPEQYAYAAEHIDIDNFIDYYLLELFVANHDWPANNVRFWQAGDRKFRWLFYDGDSGLEASNFDVYANASDYSNDNFYVSTLFFRRFLQSPQFQEKFAHRFNQLIVTTFSYRNTKPIFDSIQQALVMEVHRQFERFAPPADFYAKTYDSWLVGHMDFTRDFLIQRPTYNFLSMPQPAILKGDFFQQEGKAFLGVEADRFGSSCIEVFDLEGQKKHGQACVLAAGNNIIPLDLDLATGTYLLKIGEYVKRIIYIK